MVRRLKVSSYHRVLWCRVSFVLSFCHLEVQSVKIWARSRPERQTHKQKKKQRDRHTNRKKRRQTDTQTERDQKDRHTNIKNKKDRHTNRYKSQLKRKSYIIYKENSKMKEKRIKKIHNISMKNK